MDIINVFYTKFSAWEYDYFANDLFNIINFKNINSVNFILYNNNIYLHSIVNNHINVIVVNHMISEKVVENMLQQLTPVAVFHLSDEYGTDNKYYNLYCKYNVKMLFHQYNFTNIDYNINHMQIPLGYVSGFCQIYRR